VNPIESALIHKEERISVFLNPGLQSIGSGDGTIAAVRLAVNEENSFTSLCPKDEPGFDYIRKQKNSYCFRSTFGGRGILHHELLQSVT